MTWFFYSFWYGVHPVIMRLWIVKSSDLYDTIQKWLFDLDLVLWSLVFWYESSLHNAFTSDWDDFFTVNIWNIQLLDQYIRFILVTVSCVISFLFLLTFSISVWWVVFFSVLVLTFGYSCFGYFYEIHPDLILI